MHELRALDAGASYLVTDEFARGAVAYDASELAAYLKPIERAIPLRDVAEALAHADGFEAGSPLMDPVLAVALHRALPLGRREAADPGPWRYLAVAYAPHVVRHRWTYRGFDGMRSRFWSAGFRFDSNAFSRWWWVAELTRKGDDYALTRAALESSVLSTHLFTRALAWHRPTLAACIRQLRGAGPADVERALRTLGKLLSVRVPEAMSEGQLDALVVQALSEG
ncbi:MAG: DUF6339 family protein [Myxococcota bacterium]